MRRYRDSRSGRPGSPKTMRQHLAEHSPTDHVGGKSRRIRARRGEGERLRDEILDVAEQLLVELADADAVSIREIGLRIGVTAPSIYRHFTDKDALLFAVCQRAYDRFGRLVEEGVSHAVGPVAEIHARATAYVKFALDFPGQYRVLFMTPDTHRHPSPEEAELAHMNGLEQLVGSVERAIAAGTFRPLGSALDVSLLLWAAVHGIASLRIAHPDHDWPPVDLQLNMLFDVVALGLIAMTTPAPAPAPVSARGGPAKQRRS